MILSADVVEVSEGEAFTYQNQTSVTDLHGILMY